MAEKQATQNDKMRCPKCKGELVEMNPEEPDDTDLQCNECGCILRYNEDTGKWRIQHER